MYGGCAQTGTACTFMQVQTIANDLKTGKLWSMCEVIKSPGDGHCVLHSIINSYNAATATAAACIDIDLLSKN